MSTAAFENECFFMTAIDVDDSPRRKLANAVLSGVVEPAASRHGLTAVRADHIEEGGHITFQVIQHCCASRMAVADLTGGNLNVYYEVGLRHALRLPVILIAQSGEPLPFDLLQQRTIFYENDLAGAADAQDRVSAQMGTALDGHTDSPVALAGAAQALEETGDRSEQLLAEVLSRLEDVGSAIRRRTERPAAEVPWGVAQLMLIGLRSLLAHADETNDPRLRELALRHIGPPAVWAWKSRRRAEGYQVDTALTAYLDGLKHEMLIDLR